MALLSPGSRCPICGELINEPIFATSGLFLLPTDPLWTFCDACMHWACYATWEHRERFAKAYVQMWIANEKRNPYWARVFLDEYSYIVINPEPIVAAAHVRLFRTGSRIEIPLREWENCMRHDQTPLFRHPLEAIAWNEALPSIRRALPTEQSLHQAADWSGKEKLHIDNTLRKLEDLATIDIYNHGCEDLRNQLESAGLVCPHCQQRTTKVRFYNKAPAARSYFVCQLCARSFRLEDFVQMK